MSEEVYFEVHFKEEEVTGYLPVEECDDEAPIRFYDRTNQEQWSIPSNPYRNPVNAYMMQCEADYDVLVKTITECDFIDYLVLNQDEEGKEMVLDTINDDEVILIIN